MGVSFLEGGGFSFEPLRPSVPPGYQEADSRPQSVNENPAIGSKAHGNAPLQRQRRRSAFKQVSMEKGQALQFIFHNQLGCSLLYHVSLNISTVAGHSVVTSLPQKLL